MRSPEDAVRSVKKYLAEALGKAAPLAAVKTVPAPPAEDDARFLDGDRAFFWDYDADGDAWMLSIADNATARGYGLLPVAVWNRRTWYVNPPAGQFDVATRTLAAAATDPFVWSPGLVAKARNADPLEWEQLVSLPRMVEVDVVSAETQRPYRMRLTQSASPASASAAVAHDKLPADDWDVRFFHDRGATSFPLCVVKATAPASLLASRARLATWSQPLTIYAYPLGPKDADKVGESEAQLAAERVRTLLARALGPGVSTSAQARRPARIPLYDYDGLGGEHASSQREPYDFLRIADASVAVVPEPNDPRQPVVVADVRVQWDAVEEEERGHRAVEAVGLGFSWS